MVITLIACVIVFLSASSADKGFFLHLTDLHYDEFYEIGSSEQQDCHRIMEKEVKSHPAGPFGSHRCDSPPILLEEGIRQMSQLVQDPAFILMTGDAGRHDDDILLPRTGKQVKEANARVLQLLLGSFPNVPIIPTIGNNDVILHNSLAEGPNEDLDYLWDLWKTVIPSTQQQVFLKGGYFSFAFRNLRIISLNTLFFYRKNLKTTECHVGSIGSRQLDWLRLELTESKARNQTVYIIGHIAPRIEFYFHDCYNQYLRLVDEFSQWIKGQFYGHTNIDSFTLLPKPDFDENSMAPKNSILMLPRRYIGVYYEHPSMIPTFNPSFRAYEFATETGVLLNFSQYYADLEESNERNKITFKKEYDPITAYQMKSLELEEWIYLRERMESDADLYRLFHKHKYVSSRA